MEDITKPNRDINSLNPLAKQACQLFLDTCKKRNIPIFVTEFHRSQARQDWLYEQGRTRQGNIVTWTHNSNHTGRMAWDIAVLPPNGLYDNKIIQQAIKVARELNIGCGADFGDNPHFEITPNWKTPTPPKKVNVDNEEKYLKQVLVTGTQGQKKWANDRLYLITVYRNGNQGQKDWALKELIK